MTIREFISKLGWRLIGREQPSFDDVTLLEIIGVQNDIIDELRNDRALWYRQYMELHERYVS